MEQIRLGTIGSGVIVHSILDNVAVTEGVALEAVYSRSREKGEALAAQYHAKKVYTDMEAFLADEQVNVVYIATPNLLHYPQAKQALLAGKHVILEKPFTTRREEAEELFAIAKERGLLLTEAAPTTFLPNYASLQAAVGKIGDIKLVLSNYSQYSSRFDKLVAGELPNIFNPEYGGGCLMDINFYNVYLSVALFGLPERAEYHPNLYKDKYDTSGIMNLYYPGFTAVCAGAKDTWGINDYRIEGTQGHICVSGGSNGIASVQVVTKTEEYTVNLQPNTDRWFYEVQELTKLLLKEDRAAFAERRDITLHTVSVLEQSRKQAGIFFPRDV